VCIQSWCGPAILDSAATRSLISRRTYEKLGHLKQYQIREIEGEITLADKSTVHSSLLLDLNVVLAGRHHRQSFMVVENLSVNVILGNDYITRAGVVLINARNGYTFSDLVPLDVPLKLYDNSDQLQNILCHVAADEGMSPAQNTCISQGDANEDLSLEQKDKLRETLLGFKDIITDQRVGFTDVHVHKIETGEAKPIQSKPYHASPYRQKVIDQHVEQLLRDDIIEPSTSPWCSPVCLPVKADGTHRFAIDLRKVNKVTTADSYPNPTINEALDAMNGASWFSSIDLKSGYHQVSLHPDSREKTAFRTRRGLFQYKRLVFGAKNSGACFQRTMDKVLEGLQNNILFCYSDDIIIYSKTFEDHIRDVSTVLERLRAHGLTINPKKSLFARRELKFLGHIINQQGVQVDPDKVRAVAEFPRPHDNKKLSTFLGMVSWYARFIPDMSKTARPLNSLRSTKKPGPRFKWTKECQEAFEALKQQLCEAPLLSYPQFDKEFCLQVDASDVGLGACLFQEINGAPQVIAYASKTLNAAERNYSCTRKEALACVWGVEKFHNYLDMVKFKLVTDHQGLTWLFQSSKPTGQMARWILRLQAYDFEIIYRPGRTNYVADALSRNPLPEENQTHVEATAMIVKTSPSPWELLDAKELRMAQEGAEELSDLRQSAEIANSNAIMRDGIIYQPTRDGPKPVIPIALREELLKACHDDVMAGHMGISQTIRRVKAVGVWPGLVKDVSKYVKSCRVCQITKPYNQKPAGLMVPRVASRVIEQVAMDFVGPLPMTGKRHEYILVFTDRYSRWCEFYPVRKATARVVVKALRSFITQFGVPISTLADNATQFRSKLLQEFLKTWNIKGNFITPYHASSNIAERRNRDLKIMLRAYCVENHNTWDEYLEYIRFALNSAVNETTGVSPAELFLGRKISSPVEMKYMTRGEHHPNYEEAFEVDLARMAKVQEYVADRSRKMKEKQARFYNQGRRDVHYVPGQHVLIKAHPISSAVQKHAAKLAAPWTGPYEVLRMFNNVDLELRDIRNHKRIIKRHVCEVKPYVTRTPLLDEELVIAPEIRQPTLHAAEREGALTPTQVQQDQQRAVEFDEESVASSGRPEWQGRLRQRSGIGRREYYQAGF
jgi:transposase InsO family protein